MRPGDPAAPLVAEPNVTPMIDVLLVLLIVFMLVIPLNQHLLSIQLPVESPATGPADHRTIILSVTPDGQGGAKPRYAVNQRPVAAGALTSELKRVFARRPDKVLFVAGSPAVLYQDVISAMDAARAAGVEVIAMAPKRLSGAGEADSLGR